MVKKIFRFISKILLSILILMVLLISLAKVFEKKIVNKAVLAINQQLDFPIYVSSISFSFIKNFPQASIHLNNFTILSGDSFEKNDFNSVKADTLLFAKDLSLSLNTMAFLKNSLTVSEVNINKGFCNYLIDNNGKSNLPKLAIKESTTEDSNSIEINIEKINLNNLSVNIINKYKDIDIKLFTKYLSSSANIQNKNYSSQSKGTINIGQFIVGKTKFKPLNSITIDTHFDYFNDTLSINKGGLYINKSAINASGYLVLKPNIYSNIKLQASKMELGNLTKIISIQGWNKFDYKLDGIFDLNTSIKGNISSKVSPAINASINLYNGKATFSNKAISINNISAKGKFTNGSKRNIQSSKISITNFNVSTDSSSINGKLSIENLKHPTIKTTTNYNLSYHDINNLFNDNNIVLHKGLIKGYLKLNGELFSPDTLSVAKLIKHSSSGKATIENAQITFPKDKLNINNINAELTHNGTKLNFKNLETIFAGTKLNYEGIVNTHLSEQSKLTSLSISGNVITNTISYDSIQSLLSSNNNKNESLPINISLQLLCSNLMYKNIEATSISTHLKYTNNDLSLHNLNFYAFNGRINSNVRYYSKTKNIYTIQTQTKTNNIDINSLFKAFNNFNQTQLTSNQIYGNLTSDFHAELTIRNGKPDMSTFDLLGHLKISDGKLINFEPIQNLSSFSQIDELGNIEFSNLENDLLIAQQTIHIPQMTINSNAFDMSISGQQEFMGDYEYHFQVFLSDFLKGKAKRIKQQQTEFGVIEDDGLGRTSLYLVATNINGESKVKLDKKEIRLNMKTEYQQQKTELKNVFNEEFGWFNADSAKTPPNKKQEAFEIEWDDD